MLIRVRVSSPRHETLELGFGTSSGLRIGRRKECDVKLDAPSVSRLHALLYEEQDMLQLKDLGSRYGTRYDGRNVIATPVHVGASIQIGIFTLTILDFVPTRATLETSYNRSHETSLPL